MNGVNALSGLISFLRGQSAMHKKEQEVARYNADKLQAILNQLRELNELQFTTNGVVKTISGQLRR